MYPWENQFEKRVLTAGKKLVAGGFCDYVNSYGNIHEAFVRDTKEDYLVQLKYNGTKAWDFSCSCKDADAGKLCKHLAALLYVMEDAPTAVTEKKAVPQPVEDWEALDKELRKKILKAQLMGDARSLDMYVPMCLQNLQQAGRSEKEQLAFAKQFWGSNSDVRQLMINEYETKGQYKKAISVLNQSKKFDGANPRLLFMHRMGLIRIYEARHMKKELKKELLETINGERAADLNLTMPLRDLCTPAEWNGYVDQFVKNDYEGKFELLLAAELYGRLWKEIKKSYAHIALCTRYERVLQDKFGAEICEYLLGYVAGEAAHVTTLKAGRELMPLLERAAKYVGGAAKCAELVAKLRKEQANNKKLLSVLEEAGY